MAESSQNHSSLDKRTWNSTEHDGIDSNSVGGSKLSRVFVAGTGAAASLEMGTIQ